MLTVHKEFLSAEDTVLVRDWMSHKGAAIFKRLLASRVNEAQIEATQKFSDKRERMLEDGRELMRKSFVYRDTLDVFKDFADINNKLYTVKIIEDQL